MKHEDTRVAPVGVELSDADIKWDMRHIEPHLKDADAALPTLLQGVRRAIKRAQQPSVAPVGADCEPPFGYRVEQHVSGNWFYAVGDHASADYWPSRTRAVFKAWEHRERQLLRLAQQPAPNAESAVASVRAGGIVEDERAALGAGAIAPSAPVGVEGIEAALHRVYMEHPDSRLTTIMIHDMAVAVAQSLAQQPAPAAAQATAAVREYGIAEDERASIADDQQPSVAGVRALVAKWREQADGWYGDDFNRGRQSAASKCADDLEQSLAQQPAVDFDAWRKNPYTVALLKSVDEDYVPKHAQQPTADAEAAEQFRKGWEAGHVAAQQSAAVDEAMARRYLAAQKAYVAKVDAAFGRQVAGTLHRDDVIAACMAGLTAALAGQQPAAVDEAWLERQEIDRALSVVNDAANSARRAGDYKTANALVQARITLFRAISAVRDGS